MSPDDTFRIVASVERGGMVLEDRAIETDPDAVLVALGHRFEALAAELATLQTEDEPLPMAAAGDRSLAASVVDPSFIDTSFVDPSLERIEAILSALDPIERAIMAIPATTVVGLGVKARHAAHVLSNYWADAPEQLDWHAKTVRLLIESTCAVAGVRVG